MVLSGHKHRRTTTSITVLIGSRGVVFQQKEGEKKKDLDRKMASYFRDKCS